MHIRFIRLPNNPNNLVRASRPSESYYLFIQCEKILLKNDFVRNTQITFFVFHPLTIQDELIRGWLI